MKSALLGIDKNDCVNVPVSNYSMNVQYHSEGQILDKLYAVMLPNSDSDEVSEGTYRK